MICDRLKNIAQYRGLSPAFDVAIDFLLDPACADLSIGRHEIKEGVYCSVQIPELHRKYEDTRWECHRQFIDIQYIAEGAERIDCANVQDIPSWAGYDAQKDIDFAQAAPRFTTLSLRAGEFAVFFPGDAHRPCLSCDGCATSRKLVVKVPVANP